MLEDALGSDRKLWTLQDALAFLRILEDSWIFSDMLWDSWDSFEMLVEMLGDS